MTDRVHPRDSPSRGQDTDTKLQQEPQQEESSFPPKPRPPPGTYVVQIPKDQIYRYPPQENARRYQKYAHQKPRRNRCCCCFCWTLAFLVLLILFLAISAGVIYLVFRPKAPKYSVEKLSIKGFNLTRSSAGQSTFSPEFDVTVRSENPNNKIGVYYRKGSSVAVSYSDAELCTGVFPAFYQPSNNVTVFRTALIGSGIRLSTAVYEGLMRDQRRGGVPLGLDLKVPVRIKFGSLKTWTITVKVHCDIRVDKLNAESSVVSNKCNADVVPWKRV